MLKLTTAGESHGRALTAIIEGLPSNLKVEKEEIDYYLALRQSGYGRGARQKIESDRAEIVSGIRDKLTLGSPVCIVVENKDYKNWEEYGAFQIRSDGRAQYSGPRFRARNGRARRRGHARAHVPARTRGRGRGLRQER